MFTIVPAITACVRIEPDYRRDTIAVESVTRTGSTLTSDAVDRFPRVRQRHTQIVLGADGAPVRIIGAGYWRKGKAVYETENHLHE